MTAGSSPIARAIAELETERENLRARIAKLETAIASLRELFHLPADRLAKAPSAAPAANGNGNGHDGIDAKIRAALRHGALSPMALATAVGLERGALNTFIADLERSGVLISTGATRNRRIALAAGAAKEAL